MNDDVSTRPGRLIQLAARLGLRWVDARLQKMGLAAAQVPVLYALKDGLALSQKALAELSMTEQPTMTQLIARMERDGLIRRTADPKDGRSSLISLTAQARRKVPKAAAVIAEGSEIMLRGFSEQEVATLRSLLQRAIQNMEADLER